MKNPFMKLFAAFFLFVCSDTYARDLFFKDSLANHKMIFEIGYGRGFVNNQRIDNSVVVRAGRDNYFLTARFLRSEGYRSIFENSWMAGYRMNFNEYFNATCSVGAGDIAFVNDYKNYNETIMHETVGITLEAEVQARFRRHGIPSAWSFFAVYYTTFNDYNNLNGINYGLVFCPQKYPANREKIKALKNEKDILYWEKKAEKKRQREIKKTENFEHNNNLHWEYSALAGVGDHPLTGGFEAFVEFKKIIFGGNLVGSYPKVSPEQYHPDLAPPNYLQTRYHRNRQLQGAAFFGYRIWETHYWGINAMAGAERRRNMYAVSHEAATYSLDYGNERIVRSTGFLVQSEQSYTFRNRNFGFALTEYADFFKGYSSAGAAFSVRFGILR